MTLRGEKAYYFECQILFLWKETNLKRKKYCLKPEAGIVSCTKSNNSLTNALVKHEAKHMPDILKMRGVTWSYKPKVIFTSSKLNIKYYQAKIYGTPVDSSLMYSCQMK